MTSILPQNSWVERIEGNLFKSYIFKCCMKYSFKRNLQILKVSEKYNFSRSLVRIGNKQHNPPRLLFPSQGAQLGVLGVCTHNMGPGASAVLYCWGNCVWTQPSGPPVKHWSCASATASGLGAASPRQCWQLTHAPGKSLCSHIYTQCVPTNSCIICRDSRSLTLVCYTVHTLMMVKSTYRNPWCQTQNCITNQYPKPHFQEKFAF